GLPVRGILVRLTDAWTEILQRRTSNSQTGAYPEPVQHLLGELLAAATLMQSNIKFDGALVVQVHGDGPVKLLVAEVQPDLRVRATATVSGVVDAGARLSSMVNAENRGRCAITLDPKTRFAGQQPYQGVVPLFGDRGEKLEKISDVLEHYMLQSEQLDTRLVLAADDRMAAGLLIQRMPLQGARNLGGQRNEDEIGRNEDYRRIALLAASLRRDELLSLDAETILRRLFWEERLLRLDSLAGSGGPHFACSCSREKVSAMIVGLGAAEADSIVAEQGHIEVACEFCGKQYRFDRVDATELFQPLAARVAGSARPQ
ncbi:MAG: Hsp33 family molecular chaperone HslO, partial [Burkholderiaceae bacterium]